MSDTRPPTSKVSEVTTAGKSRRALVTGALGNVGREVVRSCLKDGLKIRAAGSRELVMACWPGVEGLQFDFSQPASWPSALECIDWVFLMRPPQLTNMSTTLNPFIDAAYSAGVKHVVFLSVAGAENRPWVPHRKVEDHLKETGTAWTILRPGSFAQNLGDAYLRDIVEDDRLFVPAAQGRVAFLDVADADARVNGLKLARYTHRKAALQAMHADPAAFDLVLNDCNMPGMSRLDVAREVKEFNPSIPVAVISQFIDEKLHALASCAKVSKLIFKVDDVDGLYESMLRALQKTA